MAKRLSPAAVVALKEALGRLYWYKSDLRSFLTQCIGDSDVLAKINWDDYKWQIASNVVDALCADQDKHLAALTRVCQEVCGVSSFRHLEALDGGIEKAKRAREAVDHLKSLVSSHDSVKKELDAVEERQRREQDRIARSGAVRQKLVETHQRYMQFVVSEDRQGRGYDLERVMYDIFELFDLDPRASFKVTGEQIDGAFSLDGTEYLFEGKWKQLPSAAAELDAFSGKIQRKLDNTLGLFLAINGCSAEALQLYNQKRSSVIVMDGAHLMAVLEQRIDFVSLLTRLRRHAAQNGVVYLPIHEILLG